MRARTELERREIRDKRTGRLAAVYHPGRGELEIRHGKRRDVIDVRELQPAPCPCRPADRETLTAP